MSSRSANYSYEELGIMLSALERDEDLITNVLGRSIKDRKEQDDRWQAVADLMNAVGRVTTERKGKQVRKKWNELKSQTKKTAANLKNDITKTGGGEPNYELHLTPLELRILQLIGKSSYEGCTGMKYDLAAAKISMPITPSRASQQSAPSSNISQPLIPTSLNIPQPPISTSTPSSCNPQPPISTSTPSSCNPQPPISTLTPSSCNPQHSFLNISSSSEYNDLSTAANSMPEDYDGSSYLPNANKENESSWVFGFKNQSESSGTVRKRNSRGRKRKIFEESDTDTKVIETQDEIKNSLLEMKNIAEKQLNIQEKLLNVAQDVSENQGLIINKLDHLLHLQNNTNVLLEAIGGFQVVNQ